MGKHFNPGRKLVIRPDQGGGRWGWKLPHWNSVSLHYHGGFPCISVLGPIGRRFGAARGELPTVVVVVLGRIVVDVGDGHDLLEVGVPADRKVSEHAQHTTKPLARRTLRISLGPSAG